MAPVKHANSYYYCVMWVDSDGGIQERGNKHSFAEMVQWAQAHLEELPDATELKIVNKRAS